MKIVNTEKNSFFTNPHIPENSSINVESILYSATPAVKIIAQESWKNFVVNVEPVHETVSLNHAIQSTPSVLTSWILPISDTVLNAAQNYLVSPVKDSLHAISKKVSNTILSAPSGLADGILPIGNTVLSTAQNYLVSPVMDFTTKSITTINGYCASNGLEKIEKIEKKSQEAIQKAQNKNYISETFNFTTQNTINEKLKKAVPINHVKASCGKEETQKNIQKFSQKIDAFVSLSAMLSAAGIDEPNNLNIYKLIQEYTEKNENNKSLWQIFITSEPYKNISIWKKFSAGFCYLLLHRSAIISSLIEKYLKAIIIDAKEALTKDPDTRVKFIQKVLEHINNFLEQYNGSIKQYCDATIPTPLSQYHTNTIKNNYGGNLEKLSIDFISKFINRYETSFWIRWFILPFLSNRLINWMFSSKQKVAQTIAEGIQTSINAADPTSVSFKLALTKFANEKFQDLNAILDTDDDVSQTTQHSLAEAKESLKDLPIVIQNLLNILNLVEYKTQNELKKELQNLEQKKWYLEIGNTILEDIIKTKLFDIAQNKFSLIVEKIENEEIFAQILDISCAPFSDDVQSAESMHEEYQQSLETLNRTTLQVFEKIVKSSIDSNIKSYVDPSRSLQNDAATEHSFNNQKVIIDSICKKIEEILQSIQIENPNLVTQGKEVQEKIARCFQLLYIFSTRTEIRDQTDGILKEDQTAIWQQFKLDYEKLLSLTEKIENLEYEYSEFIRNETITSELNAIIRMLEKSKQALENTSRHEGPALITSFKQHIEKLQKNSEDFREINEETIQKLTNLIDSISKEQQAIDVLEKLNKKDDAIDLILQHQKGIKIDNINPKELYKNISENLSYLPKTERTSIANLVLNNKNWNEVSNHLTNILTEHTSNKTQHLTIYNEQVQSLIHFLSNKKESFTKFSDEFKKTSKKIKQEAELQVQDVMQDIENMTKPQLPYAKILKSLLIGKSLGTSLCALVRMTGITKSFTSKTKKIFDRAHTFVTGSSDLLIHAAITRIMKEAIS